MSSDIMKDFDTIAPPKRIARIGGEEVDVSVFSTRATLKLIEMTDSPEKIRSFEEGKNIESFVEVVATACQHSNPKITADWLMDNVDMFTLVEFSKFVLEPIIRKLEEMKTAEDSEKNCH